MKSNQSHTNHFILATLILAALSASTGAAQATCAFNGPHCVSGKYPDLRITDSFLDSALSSSNADHNGADDNNLPLPSIVHTPKGGFGNVGKVSGATKLR